MNRHVQEKKIKAGLRDTSDGGLGDTLKQWNENYFAERGLHATLELSHSAMKRPHQSSRIFRKESHWYGKEDRERKRTERKFQLVITKLDREHQDSDAVHELFGGKDASVVPELASGDAKSDLVEMPGETRRLAEMPGEDRQVPVELPAMELPACVSLGYGSEKLGSTVGYAELDGDTLENAMLDTKDRPSEVRGVRPAPLMVTASQHEALHKKTGL